MEFVNSIYKNMFALLKRTQALGLGFFAFVLICFSFTFDVSQDSRRHLIAPPPQIEHMVFGNREVAADFLWIRAIQDFDYCEQELSKNVCQGNSWLYRMLIAITDLSPSFRMPYAVGGLALSVIITDLDGATKFFERGVRAFPDDWPILFRAAYHHIYETNDRERAAQLLIQAGNNGAPPWVFALAGRLYSDSGKIDLAQQVLGQMIEENQDPLVIKRLRDKLKEIQSAQK